MKTMLAAASLAALTSPVLAGIPVGRGEIFSAVSATATYDSNVYGTHRATDDYSATLAPRLTYLRQAALIEAEANVGISFIRYRDETALDAENLEANAALRFAKSTARNYSGSLSASYLETSDVDTDVNTRVNTATSTYEARSALRTGPRSDLAVNGRFSDARRDVASDQQTTGAEFAYGYQDFFHGNNLRLAANYNALESSGDNARDVRLDQTAYTLTAGLNRTFAHDTLRAGLNYGYRVLERSADETAAGTTREGGAVISASLDGPFLPKKHFPKVESRFGITYQDAATPGIDDTGSKEVTGYLGLVWQARERTRVSLATHRSQRLSVNDLSVVSTNVRLGLDQTLRPSLTGSLSAGYDWSSYSSIDREDRTASISAGLRHQFARAWDANLTYAFSATDSDVRASDYDRHLVGLSVTGRF